LESFKKKWVSIALLSVVVPVGLLVSFRLTGILQEPLTPEIIELEAANWNMTRPTLNNTGAVPLDENVVNSYEDSVASMFFKVGVGAYYENDSAFPFWGYDGLIIRLNATARVTKGFVYSLVFKFALQEGNAIVETWEDPDVIELYNVRSANLRDDWWIEEPYAEFYGENQPKDCRAKFQAAWVFLDENSMDQQMSTTLEVTYFDGTVYRRAVLPILLKVSTP